MCQPPSAHTHGTCNNQVKSLGARKQRGPCSTTLASPTQAPGLVEKQVGRTAPGLLVQPCLSLVSGRQPSLQDLDREKLLGADPSVGSPPVILEKPAGPPRAIKQ